MLLVERMKSVIREINAVSNNDFDSTTVETVRFAIQRFQLNEEEVRYLCRHYNLLTEDVR